MRQQLGLLSNSTNRSAAEPTFGRDKHALSVEASG